MIHQRFVMSSFPNQFVPETVSPLPVRQHSLFILTKNSFLSMAPLTNAIPAFSTL